MYTFISRECKRSRAIMGLEAIKLTNLPALCKTATRQSNKTGVLNNDISVCRLRWLENLGWTPYPLEWRVKSLRSATENNTRVQVFATNNCSFFKCWLKHWNGKNCEKIVSFYGVLISANLIPHIITSLLGFFARAICSDSIVSATGLWVDVFICTPNPLKRLANLQ